MSYDLDDLERLLKSEDMIERLAGMQAGIEALPEMIGDLRALESAVLSNQEAVRDLNNTILELRGKSNG